MRDTAGGQCSKSSTVADTLSVARLQARKSWLPSWHVIRVYGCTRWPRTASLQAREQLSREQRQVDGSALFAAYYQLGRGYHTAGLHRGGLAAIEFAFPFRNHNRCD